MVRITFTAGGVTLNFVVECELECFHCIEARFDSGLVVMHPCFVPSNNPAKHTRNFSFICILSET
jgi:hypothetical protein